MKLKVVFNDVHEQSPNERSWHRHPVGWCSSHPVFVEGRRSASIIGRWLRQCSRSFSSVSRASGAQKSCEATPGALHWCSPRPRYSMPSSHQHKTEQGRKTRNHFVFVTKLTLVPALQAPRLKRIYGARFWFFRSNVSLRTKLEHWCRYHKLNAESFWLKFMLSCPLIYLLLEIPAASDRNRIFNLIVSLDYVLELSC